MFRSLMTVIRELYLYLTNVIFMLKYSVKLRRYIYTYVHIYAYILGDVAVCLRATCVLCAVQNDTLILRLSLILHCTQHTYRSTTCCHIT